MTLRTITGSARVWGGLAAVLLLSCVLPCTRALAFNLNVRGADGASISDYRWLLQEDNTHAVNVPADIGAGRVDILAMGVAESHAPVLTSGDSTDVSPLAGLDSSRRYFISVLPEPGVPYGLGGAAVGVGQTQVTVTVDPFPVPTAQLRVMVFEDNRAISGAPELPAEHGLGNFEVHLHDILGEQAFDVFNNALGTTYVKNLDGTFQLDGQGNPIVETLGEGLITGADGIVIIRNLAPGTYTVTSAPRDGQPWVQTSALGGGPGFPVTVRAGEPPLFLPGGLLNMHVFIGFVREFNAVPAAGTGTIQGQCVSAHAARAPQSTVEIGPAVTDCFVGLNAVEAGVEVGILFQKANPDGTFSITQVPEGTWQLVQIDRSLNHLMTIRTVVVGAGASVNLGPVTMNGWVASLEGFVFTDDVSTNGTMDAGEPGIPGQIINLRDPDGSILQSTTTESDGSYSLPGIVGGSNWTIAEVDFARLKATGAHFVADQGAGQPPDEHTEQGVVLIEGMVSQVGQGNRADWGKTTYGPGPDGMFDTVDDENGGITGIIYYDTTRAENDPVLAVGEPWEAGIPRVQVNLYQDADGDGIIDDMDGLGDHGGSSSVTLADVDNWPFQWTDLGAPGFTGNPGPEDIDRNYPGQVPGVFHGGDAIQISSSDSFNDNLPAGCSQDPRFFHGQQIQDCAENLQTWNQFRPAVFDGGYALDTYVPGGWDTNNAEEPLPSGRYIVEASAPPGYEHWKEEDRNVDSGDQFVPALLPPPCVGELHVVPQFLAKDGTTPAPFANERRPLCDRKQVPVTSGQNAVADFHLFTQVPIASRIVGQVVNVNAPQPDPNNPNFGGFFAPSYIPVAIKSHSDEEIARVYTDEGGMFEVLVPSTNSPHVPAPSGVSPQVWTICPNDPGPVDDGSGNMIVDPQFDPRLDQLCYPFAVLPGKTTRALVPVEAITAVVASTTPVDCEFPEGTPVIDTVDGPGGGPVADVGDPITITSPGTVQVPNADPAGPATTTRDFGFGTNAGGLGDGAVTVGGVPLNIISWADTSITATIPSGVTTGQLMVTRDGTVDNGITSTMGITLYVNEPAASVVRLLVGQTIQEVVDAAAPNSIIIVPPGTYRENVILWKPLRLQGTGAWSTKIDGGNFSVNKQAWRSLLQGKVTNGDVDLIAGQREDFLQEEGSGILVLGKQNGSPVFSDLPRARIDGFTITRASFGSGVFVNGNAPFLVISNDRFEINQGSFGGGIRIGWPTLVNDTNTGYTGAHNENIIVHNDQFNQNGSLVDGGGMGIYKGADNYTVRESDFCGNYSVFNGAGLSHFGLSPGGVIRDNAFRFNESFGEGGGIALTGEFVPAGAPAGFLTEGVGSVTIDSNLLQGNLAGDDGGGISIFSGSGMDVATNPGDPSAQFHFHMTNNVVVNNLSGFSAAGIAVADAVNVDIVHNVVAHNDSTALAGLQQGVANQTAPQGAGIVARANSPALELASGEPFSNPRLANNIIWHNRSFFWDANENGGLGGLLPDPTSPYWDLQVVGQGSGVGMDPRDCILSEMSDSHDPLIAYDASNVVTDPQFVDPYFNTIETTPNIIAPIFGPRTHTGDYHIQSGSPAKNAGDSSLLGSIGGWLAADIDGEARPSGPGVDIGADEIRDVSGECSISTTRCAVGGTGECPAAETCDDATGPATRSLVVTPNPTNGVGSVVITAITYDTATGGSSITGAEWWIGGDPGQGNANVMSAADASFDSEEETVTGGVSVSGPTDFTVNVRGQDSQGNWGPPVSAAVRVTGPPPVDADGPGTFDLVATPNPTNGAPTVTITAAAYDALTGGSDIDTAEYWIAIDPSVVVTPGTGTPVNPVDGAFDEVAEALTADVLVSSMATEFFILVRSKDAAGNWGDAASVLVQVTPPDSGFAGAYVQCPGDEDGDAVIDAASNPHAGDPGPYSFPSDARCMHLSAGDGFVNMADGRRLYVFGFSDLTGTPPDRVMSQGSLSATFPAPRIAVDEGDELYLSLTNVGMMIRPDLFDPHTVHWHGFPEASAIFDGVPSASIAINMGSTLTYYYNVVEPGTYMYHCHVEATEHMQMGMLGNLYVRPRQNRLPDGYCFTTGQVEPLGECAGHQHSNPDWNADRNQDDPLIGDTYAYDDGDGSTYYDVEYPIQIGSFDPAFHDADEGVQPLPFALMKDSYPMLNGRGYPDTVNPDILWNTADDPKPSQPESTRIEVRLGEIALLRVSNLNVTNYYTLATLGLPMQVVGRDAKLLRGPSPDGGATPGKSVYYRTNSVTVGGGESVDVLLHAGGVTPGTYFLYTTNLNYLSNNAEDFGGMMTEIVVTP